MNRGYPSVTCPKASNGGVIFCALSYSSLYFLEILTSFIGMVPPPDKRVGREYSGLLGRSGLGGLVTVLAVDRNDPSEGSVGGKSS